jgi:pyruvate dehydrogenase E1 component
LARDGQSCERWNRLHPTEPQKTPHVTKCLSQAEGPVVAASDYIRAFADQIRAHINGPYVVLGTDGFGRSDTRENLRKFFEVDRYHITIAALKSLSEQGKIDVKKVAEAISKYKFDTDATPPWQA